MGAATGQILTAGLGAGMSYLQYTEQAGKQREAEAKHEEMMKKMYAQAEENVYEGMDIDLKVYEQARDDIRSTAQGFVAAGQESDRGVGVIAGKGMLATMDALTDVNLAQRQDLANLDKIVLGEEARLNTQKMNLYADEAEGAATAAAAAEAAKNQALYQGISSVAGGITGAAAEQEPVWREERREARREKRAGDGGFGGMNYGQYRGQGGQMSKEDFKNILGGGGGADGTSWLGGLFSKIGGLFSGG